MDFSLNVFLSFGPYPFHHTLILGNYNIFFYNTRTIRDPLHVNGMFILRRPLFYRHGTLYFRDNLILQISYRRFLYTTRSITRGLLRLNRRLISTTYLTYILFDLPTLRLRPTLGTHFVTRSTTPYIHRGFFYNFLMTRPLLYVIKGLPPSRLIGTFGTLTLYRGFRYVLLRYLHALYVG